MATFWLTIFLLGATCNGVYGLLDLLKDLGSFPLSPLSLDRERYSIDGFGYDTDGSNDTNLYGDKLMDELIALSDRIGLPVPALGGDLQVSFGFSLLVFTPIVALAVPILEGLGITRTVLRIIPLVSHLVELIPIIGLSQVTESAVGNVLGQMTMN